MAFLAACSTRGASAQQNGLVGFPLKKWAPSQRCQSEPVTMYYKTPDEVCRAVIEVDNNGEYTNEWWDAYNGYAICEKKSGLSYAGYQVVSGWGYPGLNAFDPKKRIKCNFTDEWGSTQSSLIDAATCSDGMTEQRGFCTINEDDGKKDKCGAVPEAGNPFVISTGEKVMDVSEEIKLGNVFEISRHYRSLSSQDGILGNTSWKYNFEYYLYEDSMSGQYTIIDPEGQNFRYKRSGDTDQQLVPISGSNGGILRLQPDISGQLVPVYHASNGWIIWFSKTLDHGLNIKKILLPIGGELEFDYTQTALADISIRLLSVPSKPTIKIKYATHMASKRVDYLDVRQLHDQSLPDYVLKFHYDQSGQVSKVSRHRGSATNAAVHNETYLYEDPDYGNLITGIVDNRGLRFSSWKYDRSARVIESSHAGQVERTTISYDDTRLKRTVTNPLGKQSVYNFAVIQGGLRLKSVDGIASTSCPASIKSINYDNNGFISETVDEENRKTRYINDRFGRILSVTRGDP